MKEDDTSDPGDFLEKVTRLPLKNTQFGELLI